MHKNVVRALLLFMLGLLFGALLFGGAMIHRSKPPIPAEAAAAGQAPSYTAADIAAGQLNYFTHGGQNIGTIWGHGAYLAPDWSADYLHRQGLFLAARFLGKSPEAAASFSQADLNSLDAPLKASVTAQVTLMTKANAYDAASGHLALTGLQAEAFQALTAHYTQLFHDGDGKIGIQPNIVSGPEQGRQLTAFFAWLAWACGTLRPDGSSTYTSNWPFDPLVGNAALPGALIWSIVSVIGLLAGLGAAIFFYQRYIHEEDYKAKLLTVLDKPKPTASQKATLAYFVTAIALLLIQVGMGALTGHYTVEGDKFFGIPIGSILPYAAVRTWHLQLAVYFIATCFLASGLFIAPLIGREPKGQAGMVWVLFVAVVIVVIGSMAGTYLSVQGAMGQDGWLFGHQGYEYVELGRFWQLLLIAGMLIWLVLVLRAVKPALSSEKDSGGIVHLLLYSSISIPAFYMVGLLYGKGSHLSDAEYWRWWVVHLWVEGFFEVFATVFMAFLLSRIGAVSPTFALRSIYFSVFLYLGAGVLGTFHHLYWSGSPQPILALGAVFSALEVVPLSLVGFEAAHNLKLLEESGANNPFRWPVRFFLSVAFWNLVGAGLFGFLINPPIVLYYIQGINTTPIHSHLALFGVYGLLAITLMLFSVRHIVRPEAWDDRLLKASFWGLNAGLASMAVFSLIPSGFYQMAYAVRDGMWLARSPEVTTSLPMRVFSFMRVGPDLVFSLGVLALFAFIVKAVAMTLKRDAL